MNQTHPAAAPHERVRYSVLLVASLAVAFLVRLYFATRLLPAPIADSASHLEPIYNYCSSGKLVSYLVPYDPTGAFRFIWHGPLPPILYRLLDNGCSLHSVYELRAAFFLIIPLALLILVRRGQLSNGAWFSVSVFCLAAGDQIGFRPEHICIVFVVLACVARSVGQIALEGVCWGFLFLASPVSGLLYGILRALSSVVANPKEIPREILRFVLGALPAIAIVFSLYPYSVADWLAGMKMQTSIISSGSEGDVFTYFVRSDFLPLWGISLCILVVALIVSRGYAGLIYLAFLPFVWYFGLRRPTTSYNLLTTAVILFLLGYPSMSRRWRIVASAALLVPGLLGIAEQSARDGLSLAIYPDSFDRTRSTIASLIANGDKIVSAPTFAIFTNPELGTVADQYLPHTRSGGSNDVLITQNSGAAGAACPGGASSVNAAAPLPSWSIFKSSSSWAINVCRY